MFELRRAKLETEPWAPSNESPSHKRRRISPPDDSGEAHDAYQNLISSSPSGTVKVVKLSWLTDSLDKREVLPLTNYLLYEGYKLPRNPELDLRHKSKTPTTPVSEASRPSAALFVSPPKASHHADPTRSHGPSRRPPLLHETTSEHELPLPPIPEFLKTTYSCQRPTPADPPNAAFIEELKEVRTLRILEGDQVGVRAYSSSIASLAAYPYLLHGPRGELQPIPTHVRSCQC